MGIMYDEIFFEQGHKSRAPGNQRPTDGVTNTANYRVACMCQKIIEDVSCTVQNKEITAHCYEKMGCTLTCGSSGPEDDASVEENISMTQLSDEALSHGSYKEKRQRTWHK